MKVAYLFLLMDKIQHEHIWEEFFSQDDGSRHSIYAHPKKITKDTPKWIKDNTIKKRVKTGWCSENLLKAFCLMLKEALKDKDNKYFVFVSGTCLPLYNFNTTFKKITSSKKARFFYDWDYPFDSDDKCCYYSDQWCILNRKVAKDLIKLFTTKKGKKHIHTQRKRYKDHGVIVSPDKKFSYLTGPRCSDWVGKCPDELYPINWLIELYGKPSSQRFQKNIKYQESTFVEWDANANHPLQLNQYQVDEMWEDMCNGESIFARKFRGNAAKMIGMSC